MKGKKTCPSCQAIIPARSSSCQCGVKFYDKKPVVIKTGEITQSAGRGRKQCPSCRVFVGVRTSKCDCGHDFTAIPSKAPKVTKTSYKFKDDNYTTPALDKFFKTKSIDDSIKFIKGTVEGRNCRSAVLTPNGNCEVQLRGFLESDILRWSKNVFDWFYDKNQGAALTTDAILYFSRQVTRNDADYKKVKEVLENNSISR